MKNKAWHWVFPITVLIVVALFMRQRTLNELRATNLTLRQQLNAQAPAPTVEPRSTVRSTDPVVALSPAERTELLQLRGQIQPFRGEWQEMSNRVVTMTRPPKQRVSSKPAQISSEADRKAEIEDINAYMRSEPYKAARILNQVLGDFIKSHEGLLPDDLSKVEAEARKPLPQGVRQRFELIRSGTIPEEARPYTLVAREREPQQSPNGSWTRTYLRADGGTVSAGPSPNPINWSAWERGFEKQQRHLDDLLKQEAQRQQGNSPR